MTLIVPPAEWAKRHTDAKYRHDCYLEQCGDVFQAEPGRWHRWSPILKTMVDVPAKDDDE